MYTLEKQQPSSEPSFEARRWAMFCHLSAFLGIWFPFGSLVGPLVLWQMKRDTDPFIDSQGKEALNFQISLAIVTIICIVLMIAIGSFAVIALIMIAALVLTIYGGIKAYQGVAFRYPVSLRLIK